MNDLSKVVDKLLAQGPARPARHLRHAPPRELGLQQPCRAAGASIDVPIPLRDQGAGRHAGATRRTRATSALCPPPSSSTAGWKRLST